MCSWSDRAGYLLVLEPKWTDKGEDPGDIC